MRILMATPEANPFARSGGLAEVIASLAGALARLGHDVKVVMPLYRLAAEIYQVEVSPRLTYYFVGQDALFDREGLYGTEYGDFEDNAERFIFFSRAVVEMLLALELEMNVCHCQEWQTGLVPVYLRTLYRDHPQFQRLGLGVVLPQGPGILW
ncbi:MAG: glycogen/starch synthase [Deltaproteobacteria bacterium]|nr:glycogen/starch synthase [Deltaproteobacteria bacterium]